MIAENGLDAAFLSIITNLPSLSKFHLAGGQYDE